MHEERGLRISGTDFVYLGEGAYAIIFADRERGRIRKIYQAGHKLDHCRGVFTAEIGAYEIASRIPEIQSLVPSYYGHCPGCVIIDAAGTDVTKEFYPDLAFEAELVECPFQKIGTAPSTEQAIIATLFRRHGIHHIKDASVCLWDGKITKVIDFATREVELWWE